MRNGFNVDEINSDNASGFFLTWDASDEGSVKEAKKTFKQLQGAGLIAKGTSSSGKQTIMGRESEIQKFKEVKRDGRVLFVKPGSELAA